MVCTEHVYCMWCSSLSQKKKFPVHSLKHGEKWILTALHWINRYPANVENMVSSLLCQQMAEGI